MQEVNASTLRLPGSRDSLQEILRQGAQTMLAQAIEAEVAEWIDQHQHVTDDRGRRQVARGVGSLGALQEAGARSQRP